MRKQSLTTTKYYKSFNRFSRAILEKLVLYREAVKYSVEIVTWETERQRDQKLSTKLVATLVSEVISGNCQLRHNYFVYQVRTILLIGEGSFWLESKQSLIENRVF